ncbi:MAG: hypothetical protein IJ514_06570 [Clostridia bacterium]|nr:hypothetical protein [Clostridia bacterium]
MEERIIDDEYGRGIRLKKTKDGYVDVTDELAEDAETVENEELEGDEVAFEFPMFDVDDEDLVGLTPKEAMELKRRKEEEAAARQAEYERLCKEGETLLESGSFKSAELKFENALAIEIAEEKTEASVGFWRAKTSDFTQPDLLVEEYFEAGVENLEFDLGYKAVDVIREKYGAALEKRRAEWRAEEAPLAESVEGVQAERREYLKGRVKRSAIGFIASVLPTIALIVLTIVFGLKNFTTREGTYIVPTVVCAALLVVAFILAVVLTNKWINDLRLHAANERLSSTEEGERLLEIRAYLEMYDGLLDVGEANEEE